MSEALDAAIKRRPRVLDILRESLEMEAKLLAVGKGEVVPGIAKRMCKECGEWHGDFLFEAPTPILGLHAAAVVCLVQQLAYLEEKAENNAELECVLGSVMATITNFDKLIAMAKQIQYYKNGGTPPMPPQPRPEHGGGMYS